MRNVLIACLGLALGCSSSSDFEVGDASDDASSDTVVFETGTPDTATDSTAGDTAGDTVVVPDGVSDVPIGPPCSPAELPAAGAVFVSVGSGNDGTGDGSALTPFKTIAKGILLAKSRAAPAIVLDQGIYTEAVILQDLDAGLVVQGGWKRLGAVWSRVCDANARDLTLIQSPASVGVGVQNAKKRSGLQHLTVTTKAVADVGGSSMGVVVRGQSLFFLDDVVVLASKGGAGAATPDTPAAASPTCDPFTGCTTASATGGNGANGAGAKAGTFTFDGFVAGNGGDGTVGGNGTNGTPGAAGTSSGTDECNWGCSGSSGCNGSLKTTKLGGTGKCGCGGIGGPFGKGGKGGGASLGLFVHGSLAAVDVVRSVVTAADGGNGQNGGAGAGPSSPTKGAVGEVTLCYNSGCTGDVSACYYAGTPKSLPGGSAGGDGKTGGKGGDGGGGAGGPSYAIVHVGSGTVSVDSASKLSYGKGGTPGAGGKEGDSGANVAVP